MKKKLLAVLAGITILLGLMTSAPADPTDRAIPSSVTGVLTILEVDDFDNGVSQTVYHMRDIHTNETYELKFSGEPPETLKTGEVVTVRGRARGATLLVGEIGSDRPETDAIVTGGVSGEQKTIVIVANFLDQSVSCHVSDIQNLLFADPLDQSVDDLYYEMSFGQLWFEGTVVGPYTINYGSTSACNISAWASAADAAATAAGVSLSAYNRRVYVLPRTNPCGYTGVGTLGGNPSMAWIFRCDMSDTYAHELGHNLGIHHASTPTNEYGDTSDIMGYSGFGLRHFNGAHKDQGGWLPPEQIVSVLEGGIYTIAPLELDASSTVSPQVLIISKPDTGESYYLSYRQPIGFDEVLSPTYTKGVNIHRWTRGSSAKTYLLAVLADGGSFSDTVNGITITQTSHMDQYAAVQIQMGSAPVCTANAPSMSISPVSQSAQAGSTLTYSVSVTNMDNSNCSQTTFPLTSSLPAGWTGSLSPGSLTLAPGASGTSTFSVTSPSTVVAGDYSLTVQTSDGTLPIHTASRSATYTVLPKPACVPAAPQVGISPSTQTGQAGSTLSYLVSVTNKDSVDCQQTSFTLSRSLPAGWAGAFSSDTLVLAPGASGSSTLSITSPVGATAGNYGITATASDATVTGHTASVNATYTVVGDTTPPSAPAALTAKLLRGKVNLSWTASTDNVKVSGYNVWRNNVIIGQTAATGYSDTSIASGQSYTYFVTAYDGPGNVSPKSNQVTVNTSKGKKSAH